MPSPREMLQPVENLISPNTREYIGRHRTQITESLDLPNLDDILRVAEHMFQDSDYQPEPEILDYLGVQDPLLYRFMVDMKQYLASHDIPAPRSDEERMLLTTLRAIEARKAGTYGIGAAWRVVINGVEYIAMGGNGLFNQADPTLHAEMAAFRLSGHIKRAFMEHPDVRIQNASQAREFLGKFLSSEQQHELIIRDTTASFDGPNAELDTNLEPCAMCSVAIINEAALGGLRAVHIGSPDSPFAPLGSEGVNTLPPQFASMLQEKIKTGVLEVRFIQEDPNSDVSPEIITLADNIFFRGRDFLDARVREGGTSAAGYAAIRRAHTHNH